MNQSLVRSKWTAVE